MPFVAVLIVTVASFVTCIGLTGTAAAAQPGCGDTITEDTKLKADLAKCPSNGIVIGADHITLDLNGHAITGDGEEFTSCPGDEVCDVGVLIDRHDGVTIKDGTTRGFGLGVFLSRARDNRVLGISSSRNVLFGFALARTTRSVLRDSSGSHNPAPDGDGLGLFGSNDNRIVDSSFEHNGGPGIHVADSDDNLIKGNVISHSAPGMLIEADRNRVRRNHFARNGAGIILVSANRNVVARNHLSHDGDGIAMEKGRHNLIKRNTVAGALGDGIYLGLDAPPIGGVGNIVRRNDVRGSGDDGFDVRKEDNHSVLRRNRAVGSGDDGFDIASRSTTLADNLAKNNADLGFAVRGGAIDRGGNRAVGNGDPRRCANLDCR